MKKLSSSFLWCIALVLLASCLTPSRISDHDVQTNSIPTLSVRDDQLPLMLSKVQLNKAQIISLNDQIENEIRNTILDFYFTDCGGDSAETYFKIRDTYVGTLRLQDQQYDLFVLLLKHMPDRVLNSKVLFYHKSSHTFIGNPFPFNLYATYSYQQGHFKQTHNYEKECIMKVPDIVAVDTNEDGINEYRFSRFLHNGTANGIETTVIQVSGFQLDTLSFDQKWFTD